MNEGQGEERPIPSLTRINGWLVLYGPEFEARFLALAAEVERLKERLSDADYRRHSTVKLFAAVFRLVRETVPQDPNARAFQLSEDLSVFRRAKDHGLPERYRLYWVFSARHQTIIFLYLNDSATLRKIGARSDPYAVFKRLLAQGKIGANFEENYSIWLRANVDRLAREQTSELPEITKPPSSPRTSRLRGRRSAGQPPPHAP